MTAFFDTNILVAAVTVDSDRSEQAIELLNTVADGHTSILNVMELRTVLAKKKQIDQDRVDRIEDRIARKTTSNSPMAPSPQRSPGSTTTAISGKLGTATTTRSNTVKTFAGTSPASTN